MAAPEQTLTARNLLGASALATKRITVNGIGLTVRELSIRQRKQFADVARDGEVHAGPWLVCTACLNDDGSQMFGLDDVDAMLDLSPKIIEAVAREVMIISGLMSPDTDDAKPTAA